MTSDRFYGLDLLRGCAAIIVVIFHVQWFLSVKPFDQVFFPIYANGQIAVDVFFAISGWVLADRYGLLQTWGDFGRFMWKRFARLYPLHLVTLLVTAALLAWPTSGGGFLYPFNDLEHFGLNLSLLQSTGLQSGYSWNAPSWSISVEVIVGAIFAGAVVKWGIARRTGWLVFAAFASASVYVCLSVAAAHAFFFDTQILRGLSGFMAGVVAWRIYRNTAPSQTVASAVGIVALLVIVGVMIWFPHGASGSIFAEAAVSILFAPMLVYGAAVSKWGNALGLTQGGTWLGNISFSVYLWHYPVSMVVMNSDAAGLPEVERLAVYLLALALIATLSFRLIEMPAKGWLGQFGRVRLA